MKTTISIFVFSFLSMVGLSSFAQVSLDVETGIVKVNRNDASSSWKNSFGDLNGLEGTLFSYANDFNNPVKPLIRFRVNYSFGKSKKHFISALAAPVQYHSEGVFNQAVVFNSTVFDPQKPTEGFYKFNGYRFTYRYHVVQNKKLDFGVGLTLNFRDAEFSLKQENKFERNYNRGLVPLINTYLNVHVGEKIGFLVDGDVFYVDNTGGAIDYLAGLSFDLNSKINLKSGYRFFSGVGSETGNVYNKLFVSSVVLGGIFKF